MRRSGSWISKAASQLGGSFSQLSLLAEALTHKSYALRNPGVMDNERLEFFGDAVLKLLVSEYLYTRYPSASEGELTKVRAKIVSDKSLLVFAKQMDLGQLLLMSDTEAEAGGRNRESNLANAFEAILGALFLDGGLDAVRDFFLPQLERNLDHLQEKAELKDFKSELQEWLQKRGERLPEYVLLRSEGPDHQKQFFIEVRFTDGTKPMLAGGSGVTKKEAEQRAAQMALTQILSKNE
ncbi:MAG: ribonuclease III [Candidatus Margulisiibacteriota bacterium]